MADELVKHTCCGYKWDGSSEWITCHKTAKYNWAGKWYCGIHDPVKVKAREKKRNEKWEEKYSEQKRIREIERVEREKNNRIKKAMEHFCERLTLEFMETHKAFEWIKLKIWRKGSDNGNDKD